MPTRHLRLLAVLVWTSLLHQQAVAGDASIAITGELKQWHKVTLTLDGPSASESGTPNPFTDYAFDVTFSNGPLTYVVPGYFAADGNAGESSATAGSKWRAHLSPDLTGTWTYTVSFRAGTNVAQEGGGSPLAPFHGLTGSFAVGATDKSGRDFRGKGRLAYVGQRYLRHQGNGEWFIKAGADSPENFLNNTEIDGTINQSDTDRRHNWSAHADDWQNGDPTWQGSKGKGVIGAINYLSGAGCNVFSFLTMNINGDSHDVWPYYDYNLRTRMDCSKLDQWEVIFAHSDSKGMYLHFKTQETENDQLLDNGDVGLERKLYYRELVARFGHHLALNWNLGEENSQSDAQRKAMTQWFHDHDPYRHLVVLHTYPGQWEGCYRPLLGTASWLSGVSIQTNWDAVHGATLQWVNESAAAGRAWVSANDEQGPSGDGIPPQPGWPNYGGGGPSRAQLRHQVLWGNLMAGGGGIESYFGYGHPDSDLSCRNWRSRDDWWAMCGHALRFFHDHLPFNAMSSADQLVNGGKRWCLAQAGEVYAVYIPAGAGGSADLNLGGQSGTFTVQWYNPRSGGALQNGSVTSVSGGGTRSLGAPPADSAQDWVALAKRSGGTPPPANQAPTVSAGADQAVTLPAACNLPGSAGDDGLPAGSVLTSTWSKVSGPGTATFANAGALSTTTTFSAAGTYVLRLSASDGSLAASDDLTVVVHAAGGGGPSGLVAINAGGGASGGFTSDAGASGGQTYTVGEAIDAAGVANAAPAAVYQSERYGDFTYTLSGLTPGSGYTLRLHFAELYWQQAGQRVFDVSVNGVLVLQDFDIYALAGGRFKAVVRDLAVTANAEGRIVVTFITKVDHAKVSGIEVLAGGGAPPANAAPGVNAGWDMTVTLPAAASLSGTVSDDGLPAGSTLNVTWSEVSGPGTATFANANTAATTASFPADGTYVLRLTAHDGSLAAADELVVVVAAQVDSPTNGSDTGGSRSRCGSGTMAVLLLGVCLLFGLGPTVLLLIEPAHPVRRH